MNFEKTLINAENNLSKKEQEQEKLDDRWYERFKKIGAFQDVEYLTGEKKNREEQKRKFLNNEIENPELDYPELEKADLEKMENDLLNLKKEVLEQEENDIIKQLYRWKINEKIAIIRMLKATLEGNDKRFSRYSLFIYGKPEREIYEYTLSQVKRRIDNKMFHSNPNVASVAKRLNKELFKALMENDNSIDIKNYNIPKLKNIKDEKKYSAKKIKEAFERALEYYKIFGWKVVVDDEGKFTAINVGQEDKEIRIPKNKKLKKTQLEALIQHEIGTHVRRRENGERTKLKLLGLGLDRYLKGEEGVATFEAQKVKGMNEFAGFAGHFAIALARGIDGKKRNFREVFNILRDFYFLNTKGKKEDWNKCEKLAWNRCVRTFRGTTCKIRGACFTRDIVYREGNIGIWNLIKDDSSEARRFMIGKYDPTNPRHIWILDQLEITDDDLKELENQKK